MTRVPVSILPPRSVSSAASAAVIDPDPPAATGQPQRCPAVMMPAPIAEVSGWCSGRNACAATPPNSARPFSVANRRANAEPGSSVGSPNLASASGWLGARSSGRMMSPASLSYPAEGRPKASRQRAPSRPSPAAVSSTDRYSRPASPPSSGCAQSISGQRQDNPYLSRPRPVRNGEPTAIGWKAEQWSCSRPGSSDSPERAPPPGSPAASSTVTCTPSAARATAAASPLGPPPTTVAVVMPPPPRRTAR